VPNKPQQLLPFSTAKQANLMLNGHPLDSVKHEDVNKTLRLQSTYDIMNHIPIQIKSRRTTKPDGIIILFPQLPLGFPYLRRQGANYRLPDIKEIQERKQMSLDELIDT
jgi:hypothetical protein